MARVDGQGGAASARPRRLLRREGSGSVGHVVALAARNPAIARLSISFLLFNCVELATWIGILVYAYTQGGVTESGLVATAALVPAAIFAPALAAASERIRPGVALVVGYVVEAAACAAVAAILLAGVMPWLVYAVMVVQTMTVTLTRPVQASLAPGLARRPEELTAMNVLFGWVESISLLAAPAAAGVTLALGPPDVLFAAAAVAAVAAALLVFPLCDRVAAATSDHQDEDVGGERSLAFIRRDANARMLLLLLGAQFVAIGALDLIYVELARVVLGRGSDWVGYLGAAFGVGGVVGVAATAGAVRLRHLAIPLLASIAIWTLAFMGLATSPSVLAVLALLAVAGLARTTFDVTARTLLQRVARPDLLARVFGMLEGLQMLGLAAGALAAPLLISLGGAGTAMVGVALILPLLAFASGRRMVDIDLHATVPVVEIALLRSVDIFAALPPPTLESLAHALAPVALPAGREIIRQGDAGDRYYVIAEGEVDVLRDGRHVTSLTRGDGFGEIALMFDVPRTATIVARTDSRLYALERGVFLAAVTGSPRARSTARDLAERRLAGDHELRDAVGAESSTMPV